MQNTFLAEGQETLYGIDAPTSAAQFTASQIETLLRDGITPLEYPVGKPKIDYSVSDSIVSSLLISLLFISSLVKSSLISFLNLRFLIAYMIGRVIFP